MSEGERLLAEQARYYCDRAAEYDDWWLRRGRYDHGHDANERWLADAGDVEAALEEFKPAGDVLELACGTGLWTRRLARHARRLTALDASAEVLALARERVKDSRVTYVQADLFAWEPDPAYDVCFFGFWLSHVPEERFDVFWEKVKAALRPGGRVFFVDSLRSEFASAADHALPDAGAQTMRRRLANGREYRIVKRFYDPKALERRLTGLGFRAEVSVTPEFFLYGRVALS
jgi:2-polyprenyl-3-methyl-5-hydroxy-6-metoxy-1,4-benzoquinol methylase